MSLRTIMKDILPAPIKKNLRSSINFLEQLRRNIIISWDNNTKPFIRTIRYKDFIVYYSRGTSLIEINGCPPVRFGGTYEIAETIKMLDELRKFDNPLFLDVGANIGLITLNILAEMPHIHVFAFEPGAHQNLLFKKTIEANNLQNKIDLYPIALGQETGEISFAVHSESNVSGDGFMDTGRAGECSYMKVSVKTLDDWWKEVGSPLINVVKLDTEGSELWILKGGLEFFKVCKPVIFLEIYPENIKPYPYEAEDIIEYLEKINYQLYNWEGSIKIDQNNFYTHVKTSGNFQAKPNQYTRIS